MDNYCIIRLEKVKTWGELQARARHNNRTIKQSTDNIDETKTILNRIEGKVSSPTVIRKFYEKAMDSLSRKPRPDAVKAVELVATFSNPMKDVLTKQQQDDYFEKTLEHLDKKFGKNNRMGSWIHYDEETPHLHVFYLPIDQNKVLNFKSFLNGAAQFSKFQTEFHKEVGSQFGLERGVIREEKKKHVSVKAYKRSLMDKEIDLREVDEARAGLEALRLANSMQDERLQAREAALEARARELDALSLALQGKEAATESLRAFFEARSVEIGRQYKAKLNELGEELKIINRARELFDDFRVHMDLHFDGNIEDSNRFYDNEQTDQWLEMCDPTREEPRSLRSLGAAPLSRINARTVAPSDKGQDGTDGQSFGR